ncbi:hypothetical protein COLO4_34878 [Corchorus olitorius]|uniref:TIR domain-containing protein n=1 Tax=Corchorus olitorius TaxID=93759 RepID=A0A1R3GJ94_9ROSI|nr:hypothetical protein COLO4_34878 [Corchorus olitorius]
MSAFSSSSAFHQSKFKYGIFLSFCGKDTRKSFTDHLYSALIRKGIRTFRDDKSLERGEDLALELLRAIGESWGSIIVFSKEYAFSHWCLDELVEIMKQREERGHRVYPIFFYVEPSDFRHQRNTVEEDFKKHEMKYGEVKTRSWRRALEQVTGINGWPLKDQHESEFVEDIVKHIFEKLDAKILDEQEVIEMKTSYQKIQALLENAEDKQYMEEGKAVKVWFDELKDLAYDIEDVLDEWNTAVLKSKIERVYEAQIPSTSSSISIEVHTPSTISWFGGIALRIRELNKRLEASRVKDYFSLAVDLNSTNLRLERPKTTSLIDESIVYGRDDDKLDLVHCLLSGEGGIASYDGIEGWRQRQVESCHEKVRHLNFIPQGDPVIDGINDGMEKLIKLRHLQNGGTSSIRLMPKGMSRLTSLQTLEELAVGSSSSNSFSLADLENLIHLRGNLYIRGLDSVQPSEAREALLSAKAGLRELIIDFYIEDYEKEPQMEEHALILQALQPPPNLQILRIVQCQSRVFPNWMTSLISLKIVELSCENWESLPSLGKLPSLESLTIHSMHKVRKVGDEFLGIETLSLSSVNHTDFVFFPNLKLLEFRFMCEWKEWEYDYEKLVWRSRGDRSSNTIPIIMPKLQRLSILSCYELKTLPHHILQSRALQELVIRESRFLYDRYNKKTGHDWPSISHIPRVNIPY